MRKVIMVGKKPFYPENPQSRESVMVCIKDAFSFITDHTPDFAEDAREIVRDVYEESRGTSAEILYDRLSTAFVKACRHLYWEFFPCQLRKEK